MNYENYDHVPGPLGAGTLSMTSAVAEQAAYDILKSELPGIDCSLVEHQGVIYFATCDSKSGLPITATTQLVQYLFDKHVDQSFFILRQRIYSTESATAYAENMVRLAAKRISFDLRPVDHGIETGSSFEKLAGVQSGIIISKHLTEIQHAIENQCNEVTAPAMLKQLVDLVPRGPVLHDHNRAIAAVLTDSAGKVLDVSLNQNHKNKTLHAELLLAQNYYRTTGQFIPEGSRIYVSLKPCIMCASALLRFCGQHRNIKVYYLNDDPGNKAKNSELERLSLLCSLNSDL